MEISDTIRRKKNLSLIRSANSFPDADGSEEEIDSQSQEALKQTNQNDPIKKGVLAVPNPADKKAPPVLNAVLICLYQAAVPKDAKGKVPAAAAVKPAPAVAATKNPIKKPAVESSGADLDEPLFQNVIKPSFVRKVLYHLPVSNILQKNGPLNSAY